ncbi:MAG: PfkB family carbohydrate kinase [Halobacteriaceae archaeon]
MPPRDDGRPAPYDRLADRLDDLPSPSLSTLPDGSVDAYCRLHAGAVGPLETLEALGREIRRGERSTYRMRRESVAPGGQAVNVARQLDALDAAVTCFGHLDHPVFDGLSVDTVSMGDPALVYAFNFRNGDVMFVENTAVERWSLADLRTVADLQGVFDRDAVYCANWVSFPEMGAAFHELGELSLPRRPFVLDPGDLVGFEPAAIEALLEALGALQESVDVVYNANRQEIRATAATLPDPPADDHDRLAAVREAAGITAAVLHAPAEAAVATADGVTSVENVETVRPTRYTGGGDRFGGGLAFGLGAGWDWEVSLALGTACATHYVGTAATATPADLADLLDGA